MKVFWLGVCVVSVLMCGLAVAAEEAPAEAEKPAMRSKYPVELYGYIKFDAAYDDSRMDSGNFARWVISEENNKNDSEINMTANQSRFGLNFFGPESNGMVTTGKVEVDFYGGGPENKSHLMMRHAYLNLAWPEKNLSVLAGQSSDIVSPLLPSVLNYTVHWWVGNPGYRRPQLRVTKGLDVNSDYKLVLQGAVARTIGDNNAFGPGDSGEDAEGPTVQGRAALTFPLLTDKKTTVGVSGHYGEEEYDTDAMGGHKDYETWSVNLDLTMPICPKMTLKGEVWEGRNMDAYLAGIGQGVNTTLMREIDASGGWGALAIGPYGKWHFNTGVGTDDPDNKDLNNGDRARNTAYFANVIYDINEAVTWGFEVSHWETMYKNAKEGKAMRYQTSITFKF
ncbi:MAG: DcaP family trimeric outer membrane transporter [Planctomycetota bacterium]|jgi:hypothetical protein